MAEQVYAPSVASTTSPVQYPNMQMSAAQKQAQGEAMFNTQNAASDSRQSGMLNLATQNQNYLSSVSGSMQKAQAPAASAMQPITPMAPPTPVAPVTGLKPIDNKSAMKTTPLSTVTVDPETAVTQDASFKASQKLAQQKIAVFTAQMQASNEKLKADLAQAGMNGGAWNAMLALNSRDLAEQNRNLTYSLASNLVSDLTNRIENIRNDDKMAFNAAFTKALASGDIASAMTLAQTVAQQFPESRFWNYMATDPQAQQILASSHMPEVQARRDAVFTNAMNQADMFVDWLDTGSINSYMPKLVNDLKAQYSPEELNLLVTSWREGNNTALREYLNNQGIEADPEDVPPDVAEKAYWDWFVKNRVMPQKREAKADEILDSGAVNFADLGTSQIATLRTILSDITLNDDFKVTLEGITVPPTSLTDTKNGAGAILLTDWYGNDATTNYPDPTMRTYNDNLNQIWLQLYSQGGDTYNREAVLEQAKVLAAQNNATLTESLPKSTLIAIANQLSDMDAVKSTATPAEGSLASIESLIGEGGQPSNDVSFRRNLMQSDDPEAWWTAAATMIENGAKEIPATGMSASTLLDLFSIDQQQDILGPEAARMGEVWAVMDSPQYGMIPVKVTRSELRNPRTKGEASYWVVTLSSPGMQFDPIEVPFDGRVYAQ